MLSSPNRPAHWPTARRRAAIRLLQAQVNTHAAKRAEPWTKDTPEFRKALHHALGTDKRLLEGIIGRSTAALAELSSSPVLVTGKETQKTAKARSGHWATVQRNYGKWCVPCIVSCPQLASSHFWVASFRANGCHSVAVEHILAFPSLKRHCTHPPRAGWLWTSSSGCFWALRWLSRILPLASSRTHLSPHSRPRLAQT